jgi:hypothetical protein
MHTQVFLPSIIYTTWMPNTLLPRVPKKATQCVPECYILRKRMYSVIIFIFTHVTKLHFSVFTKTREKQKKNKN